MCQQSICSSSIISGHFVCVNSITGADISQCEVDMQAQVSLSVNITIACVEHGDSLVIHSYLCTFLISVHLYLLCFDTADRVTGGRRVQWHNYGGG